MSSAYSQESVVLNSDSNEQECESSPSVSSTHSVAPSSESISPKRGKLKTYRRESIKQVKQTLSALDSPARTSAAVASAPALKDLALDYGGKSYVPFAWYDLGTDSWRTWQTCLIEGWERWSGTWPRSGMTRNGIAYRLPPLVSLTSVTGCGLLPTIGANEWRGSQRHRYVGSTRFRGAKMSEGLRNGENDPSFLDPAFAEAALGFPKDWALLETPPRRSSPK